MRIGTHAVARRLGMTRCGTISKTRRLQVFVQVRLESEGFVAFAAVVRLGGRMRLHVSPQIRSVGERLAAVSASVRLLSRVRAHVTLQQPRPRKRLRTDGTDVRKSVSQQVHGQGRHGDVGLAASGARSSAAGLEAAMRLLVAGQVGRCRVRLSAFAANVTTGT